MEAFPVRKDVLPSRVFLRHLDKLRSDIPQLKNSVFVIAPECDMGLQANEVAVAVMEYAKTKEEHSGRIRIMDEGGGVHYGIRTGGGPISNKEAMIKIASAVVDNLRLRFYRHMICCCNPIQINADAIRVVFCHQLEFYGATVLPPIRPGAPARRVWGGKRGGRSDDLVMAFQIGLIANQLFKSQPGKYSS